MSQPLRIHSHDHDLFLKEFFESPLPSQRVHGCEGLSTLRHCAFLGVISLGCAAKQKRYGVFLFTKVCRGNTADKSLLSFFTTLHGWSYTKEVLTHPERRKHIQGGDIE